jgi:hypothetical protein
MLRFLKILKYRFLSKRSDRLNNEIARDKDKVEEITKEKMETLRDLTE